MFNYSNKMDHRLQLHNVTNNSSSTTVIGHCSYKHSSPSIAI